MHNVLALATQDGQPDRSKRLYKLHVTNNQKQFYATFHPLHHSHTLQDVFHNTNQVDYKNKVSEWCRIFSLPSCFSDFTYLCVCACVCVCACPQESVCLTVCVCALFWMPYTEA